MASNDMQQSLKLILLSFMPAYITISLRVYQSRSQHNIIFSINILSIE